MITLAVESAPGLAHLSHVGAAFFPETSKACLAAKTDPRGTSSDHLKRTQFDAWGLPGFYFETPSNRSFEGFVTGCFSLTSTVQVQC